METLFGLSNYSVVEYDQGTQIEQIAKNHDFIIKRAKSNDERRNWHYEYIIYNKDIEFSELKRNGWSLKRFSSWSAWKPDRIHVNFIDPVNQKLDDFRFRVNHEGRILTSIYLPGGLGVSGINALLELFLEVSNHSNWLEFLRYRPEITLDDKYNLSSFYDFQKEEDINLLKIEFKKLKDENEELKMKLRSIKEIIS